MRREKIYKSRFTTIALNKRAYHEFLIEKEFEAGLVLHGWEVKSLRAGKANISNAHIILRNGEAYLFGSTFQPLLVAAKYMVYDPKRNRKLLLNQYELNNLYGCVNCKNYTVIALSLHWKNAWCKLQIGVARGKKQHDKRENIKNREWQLDKARVIKNIRY